MPKHDSPYVVGDHWLDKRRDGCSPNIWQIASGTRTVRYHSTRTSDLEKAKDAIHGLVEAGRAKGFQTQEEAAVVPLLFLYWKEHGKSVDSASQIASSIRQFLAFLAQDRVSTGLDVTVNELNFPLWTRFREWRMRPHSYEVPWFDKVYRHTSGGVNGESVKRNLDDIRAAIYHHVNRGRLPNAPKVPSVPQELRSKPRELVLTTKELGAIVGYCRSDIGMLRWVLLMLATDMRPEAALAMQPDLQYNEESNLLDLHPPEWPRTKKNNPIVPVISEFKPWLLSWRSDPHRIVRSRKTAWRKMRSELGLPADAVPKTIRHSVATRLRTLKVPAEELETLMGHRIYRGSTGVYAKYDPAYLARAMRALSKVWKEVWSAADAWGAVHLLSTPRRGETKKVEKLRKGG